MGETEFLKLELYPKTPQEVKAGKKSASSISLKKYKSSLNKYQEKAGQ